MDEPTAPEGLVFTLDAERRAYIIVRVLRLGQRHDRFVLTLSEHGAVSLDLQPEGGALVGGQRLHDLDPVFFTGGP